jgi:predicted ATPase/DNA-binding CsgD family transcriptional regulator
MRDSLFPTPQPQPGEPVSTSQHNLPAPLTPLIGRDQEIATAAGLLARPDLRLLTFTGPGGVGKTRLALAVAARLFASFPDGVFVVSLAPISDPDLVSRAIADTLELPHATASSPLALLQAYLRKKRLLLVLDNFEQVLPAAPRLTDLLVSCPHLTILVTSRASLHVRGEHEFPVPPLALADLTRLPALDAASRSPAVALFVARAQAAQPTFSLNAENAQTVSQICARLDGLPLAIELAAARLKLLPTSALLVRLEQRLPFLTGGGQDAPARHQTLRQTLAWSHDLLSPEEQDLFRLLSVFVGGCTLQALEAVCKTLGNQTINVLEGIASLLDKSLAYRATQQPEGEPRFALLETVREYGLERLADAGETEATRHAHALYYLHLAEQAEPHLRSAEQGRWITCLEEERENLRAALSFLQERASLEGQTAEGRQYAEQYLRLCVALGWFWYTRGYLREGWSFLERTLAIKQGVDALLQARVQSLAGQLLWDMNDLERAEQVLGESLALYRERFDTAGMASDHQVLGAIKRVRGQYALAHVQLEEAAALFQEVGDTWGRGRCLTELARLATTRGGYTQARVLLEEALSLYQALGDHFRIGHVLHLLARVHFVSQGDLAKAATLAEQGLALNRAGGSKLFIASSLWLLAEICLAQGEQNRAHELAEESVAIFKEIGSGGDSAVARQSLARIEAAQGNYATAAVLYQESLELLRRRGDQESIAVCLEGLAAVAAAQKPGMEPPVGLLPEGQGMRWAAQLWGAAEALREQIGAPLPPVYRVNYEQAVTAARLALGEQVFAIAWAEGRSLSHEQALAAQGQPLQIKSTPPARAPSAYPAGLTAREVEVLRLVAQGLTDAQIAERLIISPRTVNNHLTSIYSKLAVSSRAAATRYALEQHLG